MREPGVVLRKFQRKGSKHAARESTSWLWRLVFIPGCCTFVGLGFRVFKVLGFSV